MVAIQKKVFKISLLSFFLLILSFYAHAQEDLLQMAQEAGKTKDYVFATFKDTRIVNLQSIETTKKNSLDFLVQHRFGNAGVDAFHSWAGLDASRDIRIAFNYGLTENLDLNIGRSKMNELVDLGFKWRFLSQTADFKMPVSVALYMNGGLNAQSDASFYAGVTDNSFSKRFVHRFDYVTQLIVASKINSKLSLELIPSIYHRNFVKGALNPNNNVADENELLSIGGGFRYKLTKRFAILADYMYTFSAYRKDNPIFPYYQPLSVGIEIETGGHVFHMYLSNSGGIMENNFIPNSPDSWGNGGYKLGFSISRSFWLGN